MTSQAPEPSETTAEDTTQRQQEWVATMHGSAASEDLVLAHRDAPPPPITAHAVLRVERESRSASLLANGATRADGAGNRAIPEEPDEYRTCFERDRDRILHSPAFRRLAGKTQVFVFPDDHQRTPTTTF